MPIFVSRFSSGRVAGANLQGARARREEGEDRLRTTPQNARANAAGEDRRQGVEAARNQEALPANNQQGDLVRARLQATVQARRQVETSDDSDSNTAQQNGRTTADSNTARRTEVRTTPAAPGADDGATSTAQVRNERVRLEQLRPGVGSVRTRADNEAERPGRFPQRGTPEALLERVAGRFRAAGAQANRLQSAAGTAARLRAATRVQTPGVEGQGNGRNNRPELPGAQRPVTPPLDRETDARVRLLASRSRPEAGAQGGVREAAAAQEEPTAVEISRANTSTEIRENLQADTQQVTRGLLRDATAETQANTRQTAQAVQQTQEARQQREVRTNESQVRELRTEERRLEQDLAQTEREIRRRESETNRLRSGVTRGPAAAAAALGTRVNILAA